MLGFTVRVVVDDLDAVVPFYERLADESAHRFEVGEVSLARVGGFLLMTGPDDKVAPFTRVQATVLVDDVGGVQGLVTEHGGEVLAGPSESSTGRSLVVEHPGGGVFEYVERRAE